MIPGKTLYHGTNHAFETFDASHLGRGCDNPTTLFGFFFTESHADALSWAQRASDLRRSPKAPRVVEVQLALNKVLNLPYERFHYYLQTARPSTIAKHLGQWREQNYDGMTVVRDGVRWFAAFDTSSITITSNPGWSTDVPNDPRSLPFVSVRSAAQASLVSQRPDTTSPTTVTSTNTARHAGPR